MSTSRTLYQDPRYLQLWFGFDWPSPVEQTPVACVGWGGGADNGAGRQEAGRVRGAVTR
jgi:hypothetical protein